MRSRGTTKPIWLFLSIGALLVGLCAAGMAPYLRLAHIRHPKTGALLVVPGKDGSATLLHNGWRIEPAGRSLPTGDMLMGGSLSPDGKLYAIVNAGYNANALHLVDVATEKEVASLPLVRTWNGLVWRKDGQKLFVAGGMSGGTNDIYVVEKGTDGVWKRAPSLKLTGADADKMCVAGLALSQDQKTLFALNNGDDALYALDASNGDPRTRLPVGDHPVACRLSADGKRLYIANWGGSEVAEVDTSDPEHPTLLGHIPTGAHPNDLTLSSDERLFVTCGNDDSVSVYDLKARKPLETIKTTLVANSPSGTTPVALALTRDEKTLYVVNADNNDVCVMDVSRRGHTRVRGFVPTGWYPSSIAVSTDGKKILVGSGKGTGTLPNMPRNATNLMSFNHMGKMLNGMISFVDVPTDAELTAYTKTVYACTPYRDMLLTRSDSKEKSAIPNKIGDPSPIKYVLYIIKENRTYDQVFGDVAKGNGDANLCLFGSDVTPNHHALAEQFVLLDNLYCNGEVSQDGHPWSTSAICVDFTQRAWVLGYSGKGKIPANGNVTDPRAGYLWEAAGKKGLSFRSYGEYQGHKTLEGHESLGFVGKLGPNMPAPGRDTDKADIFLKEFKEYEKAGTIPHFMVMSLGEDHTRGTSPGAFTPKAAVASNDQALGKIVEGISHSSVWKEFAIFVIEDDAQNGPDHVDSHRTVALAISPYIRRGTTDSTMYSTASFIRSMELILGLSPLTQYDASATPLFASFTTKPDLTPFTLVPPRIDVNAKNGAAAFGAKASARMDWSDYDRIDEDTLNRILWHSIKGVDVPMPAPVRRVLPGPVPPVRTAKLRTGNAVRADRDMDDD